MFGNVMRLKKSQVEKNRAIWYSGKDTVTILDTQQNSIVKSLTKVINAVGSEPFGFFDMINPCTLLVTTYGKEKKMLYLHNTELDNRIFYKDFFNDPFTSKKSKSLYKIFKI